MAPQEIRRQLGSMFQFFFTLGVMTSYWMDYGVSMNFSATSKQWQIPVAFQLVPGGLLGLGMLLTRESSDSSRKKAAVKRPWPRSCGCEDLIQSRFKKSRLHLGGPRSE